MSTLVETLQPRFVGLAPRQSGDHPAVRCPAELVLPLLQCLRDEFGYSLLMDVTAVDWEEDTPRFSVFYHLFCVSDARYIRVAIDCPDDEEPSVPSVVSLFPAADWHERETFDMFGIRFEGHPDLRRILMWDEYPYFPLRKEFPLAGIETELPDEEVSEETRAKVLSAPMMGGPFVSKSGAPMSRAEPRAKDQSWTEWDRKPTKEIE
ncbi:MAG: NADH-quinone oxidoreductase subunit C [Verrucomicrobiota bacterium]